MISCLLSFTIKLILFKHPNKGLDISIQHTIHKYKNLRFNIQPKIISLILSNITSNKVSL